MASGGPNPTAPDSADSGRAVWYVRRPRSANMCFAYDESGSRDSAAKSGHCSTKGNLFMSEVAPSRELPRRPAVEAVRICILWVGADDDRYERACGALAGTLH